MVEFAIVAIPFLALTMAIVETSIVYYFSAALDQVTQDVAQQIRTGAIQLSATSQQQLANTYICPKLPGVMICSNVKVSLQANANCGLVDSCWQSYYSNWSNGVRNAPSLTSSSYSTGVANNTLYLTVAFPMPLLSTLWSSVSSATVNGQPVRAIVSTAILINNPVYQH
ncbi:MAG: pilus assembly protein [Hyphomicrobiales bacterium]|nr:pilus assembly protein [Hyphomicrobiales bacterium]